MLDSAVMIWLVLLSPCLQCSLRAVLQGGLGGLWVLIERLPRGVSQEMVVKLRAVWALPERGGW